MEYRKNSSQILYAEVLSPLHIGGASEKHAQRGLDYIEDGNSVYWIDQPKLMLELQKRDKLDEFSYDIAEGRQFNLSRYGINRQAITKNSQPIRVDATSDSIRTFVANGLGVKIVPGSSLKGAVRSVLFNVINKGTKKNQEQDVFGKIDNNLMRYVQVADSCISNDATQIFTTKIMSRSAAPSNKITWKDRRSGSKNEFDKTSFITNYECLKPNTIFEFRLLIANELWKFASPLLSVQPPNAVTLFTENPLLDLLKNMDAHTKAHVAKEIAFFELNETKESKKIVAFLKNILIEKENTFLFRMASGSGFHGISGDWQFDEHTSSLTTGKDGDKRNLRYKTRRIALVDDALLPMGFVRLHLEKPLIETNQSVSYAAEVIKEKETPVYFKGAIKPGAVVFAELIAVDKFSTKKTFKLWIDTEGKEQNVILSYNSNLEVGTMHKVTIGAVQKAKNGVQIQSIIYKIAL